MNTKIVKLDINRNLYDILTAKQGDTQSRFLLFRLLDGAIPFSLENRSVKVFATKPDGKEVFNDLIINDRVKGYCTLELTNQMLAVPGLLKLELMVIEGDKKLTTNVFYMDVKKSINSENAIVSTNEFSALLNGLASLNEYDNYKNEIAAARDGEVNLLTKVKKIDEHLDNNTNKLETVYVNMKFPPTPLIGAKADGITDDTQAIQNIINFVQTNYKGATLYFPDGDYKIDGTILVTGCGKIADILGVGGIHFIGESMRATRLIKTTGGKLMQWGTTNSKTALGIKNMTLLGNRNVENLTIGLDSYTVGGGYIFENILVDNFDIGIRYHDCTFVDGNTLNIFNCGIGLAMGFYSDVMHYHGCKFNHNDISVYIGYYNEDRGQDTLTESHASGFFTCGFALDKVSIFIQGAGTECISINNCYFEQYSDIAIRISDKELKKGVGGTVSIDNCFFNGNRAMEPVGKVPHAIEINIASNVIINGGGFRNHTDAPINIRHFNSGVRCKGGNFLKGSGEKGDIKLVDGTYYNLQHTFETKEANIGKALGSFSSQMTALPGGNVFYENSIVTVKGNNYMCENVSGSYKFVRLPKAQELNADRKFISATEFKDFTGTTTMEEFGATKGWLFEDEKNKSQNCIYATVDCPKGWNTFDINILWVNKTSDASGNCNFGIDYNVLKHDGTVSVQSQSAGIPAGAVDVVKNNKYFSNISIDGTEIGFAMKIYKNLSDGYVGNALILGVELVRKS